MKCCSGLLFRASDQWRGVKIFSMKVTVRASRSLSPHVGEKVVLLTARGTAITRRGITGRSEIRQSLSA